jgi:hypothetical protein
MSKVLLWVAENLSCCKICEGYFDFKGLEICMHLNVHHNSR